MGEVKMSKLSLISQVGTCILHYNATKKEDTEDELLQAVFLLTDILDQYKHCNLKAIYLLIYQVNSSVYKMIANNKTTLIADSFFCPNLVWVPILYMASHFI